MARQKGDRDKKKRKPRSPNRFIEGIKKYPITKGVLPITSGAYLGAVLGGVAGVAASMKRDHTGIPRLQLDDPKLLRNIGIGAGAGAIGLAALSLAKENDKDADKRIQRQYQMNNLRGGLSPENHSARQAIGLGVTGASLASIGIPGSKNSKRIASAAKKYGLAGAVRMANAVTKRRRKSIIGVGVASGTVGGLLGYKSAMEYNERARKPKYGPVTSSFSTDTYSAAEFARKKGSKDKGERKKRVRRLGASLAAAGIGGAIGYKVGGRLIMNHPQVKKYYNDMYNLIKERSMDSLDARHQAKTREAVNKVKNYIWDKRNAVDKRNYDQSIGLLPGSASVPYTHPKKDIELPFNEKAYAYNAGVNHSERLRGEKRRVEEYAHKTAKAAASGFGEIYGASIGGMVGLGGLTIARKASERKQKQTKRR